MINSHQSFFYAKLALIISSRSVMIGADFFSESNNWIFMIFSLLESSQYEEFEYKINFDLPILVIRI